MRNLLHLSWADLLSIFTGFLTLIATIVAGVHAFRLQKTTRVKYSSDVEAIASAVKAVAPKPDERREEEREIVRRLVNEYHAQALSQAKVQFWFSVIAASSGFAIIIVAILMALMQQTTAIQTTLQVVPGIAIEAVAALFFKQAAETRERATALYDRLRTDRERSYALALVETIDNGNVKDAIKAELALHMAGLSQTHLLPRLIEAIDLQLRPARTVQAEPKDAA